MVSGKPAFFDLELRPSQPLGPVGRRWLFCGLGALVVLLSVRFLLVGAWPVAAFLALDLALLWWAFAAVRQRARTREHLRLDGQWLELVRVAPAGATRVTRLDPARVEVLLERLEPDGNRLHLKEGGRSLPVGQFLPPAERAEVAAVIDRGLWRWRTETRRR